MMWHNVGFHGYGMWFVSILFVFFWIGFAALTVWVGKNLIRSTHQSGREKTDLQASDILDRRYARGEINRSTYERMKEDLQAE